jgi:SAM-dependent methyltransferase
MAEGYEAYLAGGDLPRIDLAFLEQQLRPPARVLDLGCGPGRHVAALAQRGFDVTGVDLSEPMLRHARRNLEALGLRAELLRANLVELDSLRDGPFDIVICMFSTLGMIAGRHARQRVVDQAFRVLRPGGRFVLHVHNRWIELWSRTGRRNLLRDLARCFGGELDPGDRILPTHQGVANLRLHTFTRGETKRLLRRAGFAPMRFTPISLRPDGRLRCPWWFGRLRAYGYFAVAMKR